MKRNDYVGTFLKCFKILSKENVMPQIFMQKGINSKVLAVPILCLITIEKHLYSVGRKVCGLAKL